MVVLATVVAFLSVIVVFVSVSSFVSVVIIVIVIVMIAWLRYMFEFTMTAFTITSCIVSADCCVGSLAASSACSGGAKNVGVRGAVSEDVQYLLPLQRLGAGHDDVLPLGLVIIR